MSKFRSHFIFQNCYVKSEGRPSHSESDAKFAYKILFFASQRSAVQIFTINDLQNNYFLNFIFTAIVRSRAIAEILCIRVQKTGIKWRKPAQSMT